MTFQRLRERLVNGFNCTHTRVVAEDEVFDPIEETPSCAVHGFTRTVNGKLLVSTIPVHHERLVLKDSVLRPFLKRLQIAPEELGL